MESAATDPEILPAAPVALASALSGFVAVLLLAAYAGPGLFQADPRETVATLATILFAGLAPSCFIGMPIALLLLRDPGTTVLAWAIAGSVTGLATVAIVGFWVFGISFPLMLFSFWGELIMFLVVAAAVIGAVSGLIARLLLGWFLGIYRR